MKRKIVWVTLSSLMVAALVLASCGPKATTTPPTTAPPTTKPPVTTPPPTTPAKEKPKYGGTINTEIDTLIPFRWETLGPTQAGTEMMYESLIYVDYWKVRDKPDEPVTAADRTGWLAESWEIPDNQTVVFHLRRGVHWWDKPPANGRELVAADVKWLYEQWIANPKAARGPVLLLIDRITTPDKYTVEFHVSAPQPADVLEAGIGGASAVSGLISCPDVVAAYGKDAYASWKNALGTGPFIPVDYVESSFLILKRNPNYWDYDRDYPENKLPYVDTVHYFQIAEVSTRLAALRTGKLDILTGASLDWQSADSLARTNPELRMKKIAGSPGMIAMQTKKAPFTDARVRQAMNMAIDYETIVKEFYRGNAINAYKIWPLHPDSGECIPIKDYPQVVRDQFEYHPDKARQLLTEAGYPKGFKTKITVVDSPSHDKALLAMMVQYYAAIGVELTIEVVESGLYSSLKYAHTYSQMLPHSTGCGNIQGDALYTLSAYLGPKHMFNFPDWYDEWYATKFNELMQTLDVEKRKELFKELGIYAMVQAPWVLLPAPYFYRAWWPWVKGYYGQSRLVYRGYHDLKYFWIDQELKNEMLSKR